MADDFLDSDENTALEDSNQSTEYEDLISYVEKKFTTAKSARYTDEARSDSYKQLTLPTNPAV